MVLRKVEGQTLMETLIAMIIIASVISIWSVLYIRMVARPSEQDLLCGQSLLERHKIRVANLVAESALLDVNEACNGKQWHVTCHEVEEGKLCHIMVTLRQIKPIIQYEAYVPIYSSR